MKYIYLIVVIFLTIQTCLGQHNHIHHQNITEEIAIKEGQKGHMIRSSSRGAANTFDVVYHRLNFEIDPTQYYIKGSVLTHFFARQASLGNIEFDMANSLIVDSVLYHGNSINFNQTQNLLEINLPSPLSIGSLDSIEVIYAGIPGNNGFGSFVQDDHNNAPIVWTLSEPYGSQDWWPCKHDLNDKIDSLDVFIETDSSYVAASNGVLVEISNLGNGKKVYHWKHRYAIPAYLVAIAVTNYSFYIDKAPVGNDTIEIHNYVFPENLGYAQSNSPVTIDYMQYFDSLFGAYPFVKEQYGHAQFGWGGGMEHQTMSFMGSFNHELIAHELAHQWFGNKITCGSWKDLWLNEGFATYLTTLTIERFLGDTNYKADLEDKISNITSQAGGSVIVDDTNSIGRLFSGRLTYNKAAMVLHMLRWKMGEEDFYQAVRNYINDPLLSYGYALTEDLKTQLESESGLDLTEFFDDWLYNEGYPIYTARFYNISNGVNFILDQTQSHSSVDFFEMPVEIKLIGLGKDTTVIVDHNVSGEIFFAPVDFTVVDMEVDPNLWLVRIVGGIDDITGIDDLQADEFSIYPNPVKDIISISTKKSTSSLVMVKDLTGKVIYKNRMDEQLHQVDFSSFPKGIYILEVDSDSEHRVEKIIKQ